MSDWTDQASDLEQMQRDQALAAIPKYEGVSLSECLDCGGDIPAVRQRLIPGCKLCTDCASMAEERR